MKHTCNLWPLAIILTFIIFISGTVSLVVLACSQKVDLVSNDYYEQELKFQGQIDRQRRAQELTAPIQVAYNASSRQISLRYPPEQAHRQIAGRIAFYRPSNAGLDHQLDLKPGTDGTQSFDASHLSPGLWRLHISWTDGQREYYSDQKLVIGPSPPSAKQS
jgi:hypothetical protein